eukprot:2970187-Rhodomonas_salina.6
MLRKQQRKLLRHAGKGLKQDQDRIPDPKTWDEAMSQPDASKWKEAARAERRNLEKHKLMQVLTPKEVRKIQCEGKTIHTTKNVYKKKTNEHGKTYQHKIRTSFRGFMQVD